MEQMLSAYKRLATAVLERAAKDWWDFPTGVGSDVPAFLLSDMAEVFFELAGQNAAKFKKYILKNNKENAQNRHKKTNFAVQREIVGESVCAEKNGITIKFPSIHKMVEVLGLEKSNYMRALRNGTNCLGWHLYFENPEVLDRIKNIKLYGGGRNTEKLLRTENWDPKPPEDTDFKKRSTNKKCICRKRGKRRCHRISFYRFSSKGFNLGQTTMNDKRRKE